MNILLLEQDYLKSSNKRAHSACHSVQIAKLMQKYTSNKVYVLANPESALLEHAKRHNIQCLAEPKGMFSSLKFALLLKKYKIDILHTFDLLSANVAVKALSFASNVKHIHSENRNTEKDDMLLSPAFKKMDACIFAHKSYEGQYKFKYIYQENHRPVDFYVADIFPCVDVLDLKDIKDEKDGVISLEQAEIISTSDVQQVQDEQTSDKDTAIEHDKSIIAALEKKAKAQAQANTIQGVYEEEAKQQELNKALKSKYADFLPYEQGNQKIRFLIPYSATLTDIDTVTSALRCFHEYEGHIYKWEAYFIGHDVDFEKILKYAKKYEIQDNIAIFRKDLEEENYEKSEVCIVSAFKDEYNLEALFNAWACAKPTIITQRMPYYENAVNGKTLLVPDLDTPLSLSSVMHKVIQNVECRASMTEHSYTMNFEKLAEESAVKYDSFYSEIKKKKRAN